MKTFTASQFISNNRIPSLRLHSPNLFFSPPRSLHRLHSSIRASAEQNDEPEITSSTRRPKNKPKTSLQPDKESFSTLKEEAQQSNNEVYDRLIEVFSQRSTEDWRKLIAFSKQWSSLSNGVFERLEARANLLPQGSQPQRDLRKIARRLKIVSDEMEEYSRTVDKFRNAPSRDWEGIVAQQRSSLGQEFFNYIELRVRAASAAAAAATGDGASTEINNSEAEALAALGAQVAALVEAHDRITEDESALESAATKFSELLQADSMQDAEAKLDDLAASGRLDPALLLTMAKAYAGVKETDATKEEVKDIMAHLYFKAKETFARQAPPEVRILKFLLAVDSPGERATLLDQAFTPGPELVTNDEDYLHTTPQNMLNTIDNVLAVYESALAGGNVSHAMAGQAASLMNPEVIVRLKDLQNLISQKYV